MARKDAGYALKSPRGRPHDLVAQAFDFIEDAIHVVVAGLLVVAGAFVVWSVVTRMGDELHKATSPQEVVTFVLDKGLVLFIIAELLHTARVTIQERKLVVEPFLLVGLIAGVRRLPVITAQLAEPHGDVGYAPIGDDGMLGDLRSAALLSKQGSIDWMCLPRFDSPWIFGRLLDWDNGGYLELRPVGGALDYRQYRRDSNVIQTVWRSGHARMRVVDWMPITPKIKRVKPAESLRLIRMVQPVAGSTPWQLTFKPRFDYGRQVPALSPIRPGMLVAEGTDGAVFLQYPDGAALRLDDGVATVTGRVMPGHRAAVMLHYVDRGGKRPTPISMEEAHTYLHQTDDYWVGWLRSSTYRGRFDEPLHRSALALKLMQYLPTGAFVAAPTTSLPESPGGSLNWDYRYTWIRDTADLVNALHQLGFEDEVDGFLRWVRAAHDRHPERFQVMYTIDAEDRVPEFVLDELEGYRGSKPVRIGNAAVEQLQLDIYGELIQTAYTAWQSRKQLPKPRRAILLSVVD